MSESNSEDWVFSTSEIVLTDTVLGRGAFGEVRIAKWRNIEVACKSLHPIESSSNETAADHETESWRNEISMLSRLRHPNLVLFLGVCEGLVPGTTTSILTELLPCSLYDIIEVRKVQLELADVLDIAMDVAHGLDYLHRHNPSIVHRDISCKNILIGGNRAKIADLGQSKIFGQNTLSRQTGIPGAMAYSAPEVLTGKYSSKIDIFSFGILLVQMCTGDYPRIDRREAQIIAAGDICPVLKDLMSAMINYQPHERPTSERVIQELSNVVANDRYYPITRRTQQMKDVGVLGRQWLHQELERQCNDLKVDLHRTKSLLSAEEERWKREALKVDLVSSELQHVSERLQDTESKLSQLQIEHQSELQRSAQLHNKIDELGIQCGVYRSEISRFKAVINDYEVKLTEMSQTKFVTERINGQLKAELDTTWSQLEASHHKELDLQRQLEQQKRQLEMQVEHSRDLEQRLEQALTRWKIESDNLRNEKANFAKLNHQCALIVAKSERQSQEIEQYESRLKLYDDLPMPEEIRERFKDIQSDAESARDHVRQLLNERDQWLEEQRRLNNVISELELCTTKQNQVILEKEHIILECNGRIESAVRDNTDLTATVNDLKSQIAVLQKRISEHEDAEKELSSTLQKTRAQLSKEKARVEQYQRTAIPNASVPSTVTMNPPSQGNINPDTLLSSSATEVIHQSSESPYLLQQELIVPHESERSTHVQDLDDEDSYTPAIRAILPSVTRLAEIQKFQAAHPVEDRRPDIGIKHLVSKSAQDSGAAGLYGLMKEHIEDERVIWRSARALREIILKDETAKAFCYEVEIDGLLIDLLRKYDSDTTVQSHIMRLIGALAFGNDRFRRTSGEKGVMKCIVSALEQHNHDETAMLHVSTALTNLTHNSMENRSRFMELDGSDLLIAMIIQFKESAKVQRQGFWAILSLCGTDEISKQIAAKGADSAIMNGMLYHRDDADVQRFGCWALSNLALSGEEVSRRMKKKGAVEVCRIAAETHSKNPEVLKQARHAIGVFSPLTAHNNSNTIVSTSRSVGKM